MNLNRRIFSLVDVIASLISVIVAGGTSIPGIAVEFGRGAEDWNVMWEEEKADVW